MKNFIETGSIQPQPHHLRKNIHSLEDSYSYPWNILTELLQNSVDAIRLRKSQIGGYSLEIYKGKIDIYLDNSSKSIIVKDNGIGILGNIIGEIIQANSSQKENQAELLGSKGVGLTYCLFQCRKPSIISRHISEEDTFEVELADPIAWKTTKNNEFPKFSRYQIPTAEIGTTIKLCLLEDNEYNKVVKNTNYFDWNVNELEYILRTKTILGNTDFEDNLFGDIEVYLHINGETKYIDFSYLSIDKVVNMGVVPSLVYTLKDALGKDIVQESVPVGTMNLFDGEKLLKKTTEEVNDGILGMDTPVFKERMKILKTSILVFNYEPDNDKLGFEPFCEYSFLAQMVPSKDVWKSVNYAYFGYYENEMLESGYLEGFRGGLTVADRYCPMPIYLPTDGFGYADNIFVILSPNKKEEISFDPSKRFLTNKKQEKKYKEAYSKITYKFRSFIMGVAKLESKKEVEQIETSKETKKIATSGKFALKTEPQSVFDMELIFVGYCHLYATLGIKFLQSFRNTTTSYSLTKITTPLHYQFEDEYLELLNTEFEFDKEKEKRLETALENFPTVILTPDINYNFKITGGNYKALKNGMLVVWRASWETWENNSDIWKLHDIEVAKNNLNQKWFAIGCNKVLVCGDNYIPILELEKYSK